MKTVWNIIAVLAVANLIAIAGFVGWLRSTDRLNMDRARAVRAMLSNTLTQDAAAAAQKEAEEDQAAKDREAAAKAARPALTAAEKLAARVEATELDHQRIQRLKREVEDLQKTVTRERDELGAQRARLTADQQAFDEQVKQVAALASTEQFQKTLGILQSLKPAAAKSLLMEIMGPAASSQAPVEPQPAMGANTPASIDAPTNNAANDDGLRIAVEYLNAMEDRARTKVMTEFAKDDPALAARLLESLRKRGQFARADAGTTP